MWALAGGTLGGGPEFESPHRLQGLNDAATPIIFRLARIGDSSRARELGVKRLRVSAAVPLFDPESAASKGSDADSHAGQSVADPR
jgi:hypothetical protein